MFQYIQTVQFNFIKNTQLTDVHTSSYTVICLTEENNLLHYMQRLHTGLRESLVSYYQHWFKTISDSDSGHGSLLK